MRGLSLGVAVLVLAVLPGAACAQAFSFGFATGGGGHGHHGHHHGGYGSWYGFDFYRPPVYRYPAPLVYAPPPVYVYPAPAVQVIQPTVVPVQPSPGLSSAETTTPNLAASTASSSGVRLNSLPAQQQRANVVLRNPAENAGSVAFRVQDQVDAELNPGMARTWSDRTSLTVEFDRGGNFGATRKVLRPGAYVFVVTDEGWDLVAAVAPPSSGRAASLQKNALPGRR